MASITQILGTDSLSASRLVLNDNFASLNDQINEISGLLNTETQSLTLSGSISASVLTIAGVFTTTASTITAHKALTVKSSLTLEGSLVHSTIGPVTAMPLVNGYTKSTYVIDGSALNSVNTVNLGTEGQTITLIASGDVTIDAANIAGISVIFDILDNGTLTLRQVDSLWYVISHANTTLTF
jgi:hypothetical protein